MEINIAEYNQKKFECWTGLSSFIEFFLVDDKIPFKVEVDSEYKFIITYYCSNRHFKGESE